MCFQKIVACLTINIYLVYKLIKNVAIREGHKNSLMSVNWFESLNHRSLEKTLHAGWTLSRPRRT
jgi:hypothetical protein